MPNLTAVPRQETRYPDHFVVPLDDPPVPGPRTMPRRVGRLVRQRRGVRGKLALRVKARLKRAVQGRGAAEPTPAGVIRGIIGNRGNGRRGRAFQHITDRLTKIEHITAGADSQ